MKVVRLVDESGDVEDEYRIDELFSSFDKAQEYLDRLAEDYSEDKIVQHGYKEDFVIYEIELDKALAELDSK